MRHCCLLACSGTTGLDRVQYHLMEVGHYGRNTQYSPDVSIGRRSNDTIEICRDLDKFKQALPFLDGLEVMGSRRGSGS